jgi:type II secretory pathway pseudopilin PulG
MIVIAIIAIIAAIAIPGLLRARIASNERNCSASLKSVATSQETYKNSDVDRNGYSDFWTADVCGLWGIGPAANSPAATLNDIGVAMADVNAQAAGTTVSDANSNVTAYNSGNPAGATPNPKSGYYYLAGDSTYDAAGTSIDYQDTAQVADGYHNLGRWAVVAGPVTYDSTGNYSFFVNEGAAVFRKDFGQATVAPSSATAQGLEILPFNPVNSSDAGVTDDSVAAGFTNREYSKVE